VQRLKNLGVPTETIDIIRKTGKVPLSVTLTAPRSGVILERMAVNGMMASAGQTLFRIADISSMWVMADVPEYELSAVRVGAIATIRVRSLPGREFTGKVDLIYPEIAIQTRTARVRIELPNPDRALLANMYADVDIATGDGKAVVAVPDSAVIDTGERQVVIVDKGDGAFEPRDVKIGMRGDGMAEIMAGIAAGDRVVVSANFLIDAESNLKAALSGLTPAEAKP
jgi:Cu(I)/Ag(I) efflux system membrane fusion protein